jgi:hypothetical protein
MRQLSFLGAVAVLIGCSSAPPNMPPSGVLVPDEGRVNIASDVSYTYKELVAAPAVIWTLDGILEKSLDQLRPFTQPIILYFVYQPFAPNWSLEEARLNEDTYYVRMQAKRFRTGGDGEAMMLMKRRAKQIQLERGYAGFKVIDFSEGIESGTPIAQRYSEGIFKLVKVDPALPR